MEEREGQSGRSDSVIKVFRRTMWLIYLGSILLVIPVVYFLTKAEIHAQAQRELKLLVDTQHAIRAFVTEKTSPYFLPKGETFAPVMVAAVMNKELAGYFRPLQPNYLIRVISDNPLNAENKPEGYEATILQTLRTTNVDEKQGLVEIGTLRNSQFLISAVPTKVNADCLRCHGSPDTAPADQIAQYGRSSGYGWKPGEIAGARLVGVPIADVNSAVLRNSGIAIGLITLLFAGALLVLDRVVKRNIIDPIQEITAAAEAISLGRSNQSLTSQRTDEIGALTRAFELMRRSIAIATDQLQRLQRPPKP